MRAVYVVTSGMYSDYHIDRIFDNKEDAEQFASFEYGNRHVETHLVYDGSENSDVRETDASMHYQVKYHPETDEIEDVYLDYYDDEDQPDSDFDYFDNYGNHHFELAITSNPRLRMDIYHNGTASELLQKIVHDRYAIYKAKAEGVAE